MAVTPAQSRGKEGRQGRADGRTRKASLDHILSGREGREPWMQVTLVLKAKAYRSSRSGDWRGRGQERGQQATDTAARKRGGCCSSGRHAKLKN